MTEQKFSSTFPDRSGEPEMSVRLVQTLRVFFSLFESLSTFLRPRAFYLIHIIVIFATAAVLGTDDQ